MLPPIFWVLNRKNPPQIQTLYCLSQVQRNCASRGTKDGSPAKSLKNTDHFNFSQSMWKFGDTGEATMKHRIRNKVYKTVLKTRVITWRFSNARDLGCLFALMFSLCFTLTPAVFSVFSLLQRMHTFPSTK